MKNKNYYQGVPKHYLLCYNTHCEKGRTCLHRLVASAELCRDKIVKCVNPAVNKTDNCTYYQAEKVVRMAYGMRYSFDKVLATDVASIRRQLISHYGNGSYYLRRNGEKPIPPAEQEYINSVFKDFGYEDGATFDSYKDEFDW